MNQEGRDSHCEGHDHGNRPAETVKDPVCGMMVSTATAAGSHEHNNERYYFCNGHCLEKFRAEPEKYL